MEENFQAKTLLQLVGERPKKKFRSFRLVNKIQDLKKRILVQDQIIAELTSALSFERDKQNMKPKKVDYRA
ncbi:hypothetical protein [Leptospira phage LE4]|uniref:Uncharacterized protein n=1 Tax=Leptospira phage LE4 TaxID=2041383 RepID=A0A343LEG4_9CAUD|nr:hypothetical protein HWB34_gp61 [Leptospira phage LE4]ATN95074.1 hypothetical protein [Leptospira phage LE4]